MKKAIAIFFLLVFTVSTVYGSELLKLPRLVNHYLNHKEKSRSMSLGNFIRLHYLLGEIHDEDYPQDQQLPFKAIHFTSATMVLDVPVPPVCNEKPLPTAIEKKLPILQQSHYQSNYEDSIWQPPK